MSDKFYGNIIADKSSVSIPVLLRNNSTNLEITGATVSSALIASYWRQGEARVGITLSALGSINSAFSSSGWVEVDSTNMPGSYRLDIPNAALTSGVDWSIVSVKYTNSFVFYERYNLETEGRAPDAVLDRNMSTGTDSGSTTVRTARQALRFLRNKWTITGTTLSVKKEDDSTESWAAVVGSTTNTDGITSVDPTGP